MLKIIAVAWRRVRYRRMATGLTAASMAVGAALAISLLLVRNQGGALLGHHPYGFDLIIGPKGSGTDLTLNTLYHFESSTGTIPWGVYTQLSANPEWHPLVADAVPLAVGDSVAGCDLIATTSALFSAHRLPSLAPGVEEASPQTRVTWDVGESLQVGRGRVFRPGTIEALVGADVPRLTGLELGSRFRPTHGTGSTINPLEVHQRTFTVVGVLQPSGSVLDRSVFVTLEGFWSIDEHEQGLHAQALLGDQAAPDALQPSSVDAHGVVVLGLPEAERRISAILLRSRSSFAAQLLLYRLNLGDQAMAVNPTVVLARLLRTVLSPATRLAGALIALLLGSATLSILISSYQSVQAQAHELAALRALGASRSWILRLVCSEAAMCGLLGSMLGVVPAHLLLAVLGAWIDPRTGWTLSWWQPSSADLVVVLGATAAAGLVGMIPGYLAGRIPVVEQLC